MYFVTKLSVEYYTSYYVSIVYTEIIYDMVIKRNIQNASQI
jgi:hypothetical protein